MRTKTIEQLLMWSKELDKEENNFKKEMFNKVLAKIKFTEISQDAEVNKAMVILNFVKYKMKAPDDYHKIKSTKRIYVTPRQVAMTLMIDNTLLSLVRIGEIFEKDHASVIHAHKTIDNLIETDKYFKLTFNQVKNSGKYQYKKYFTNK
jgi:chromosomal replication initiation ATPase DnaA